MNYSPIKAIRSNGKTINYQDLPADAWKVVFGGDAGSGDLSDYYHQVSWAFRAVDLRMNAVQRMPFAIYQGKSEIDGSDDYRNALGWLPNPSRLMAATEAALTVWGRSYLYKRPSLGINPYSIRYLLPTSIRYEILEDGSLKFTRHAKDLPADELIYFWKTDPFVEIGPPKSGPLTAAAGAAGVLLNVDKFAAAYFERGAIKATLLAVAGNPPDTEKRRIKSIWKRVMGGIKNAFGEMVINAESMSPIVVGEGLEALSDKNLTQEKREAIATALGIPHSMLFSASTGGLGGGGVADADRLTYYETTIVPECRFIESVLNEQLFDPLGYRFKFTEENLDIFQEDEASRADAITKYMAALAQPEEFLIAAKILGVELDPDVEAAIQKLIAAKEERREQMETILPANTPAPPDDQQEPPDNMRALLDKWQTKAERAVKRGKSAAVDFDGVLLSDNGEVVYALDPEKRAGIAAALGDCKTIEDVRAVFAPPAPVDLAGELQKTNQLLERLGA